MKLSRRRRKPAPETAEPASAAPAAPVLQLRIFANTDLPALEFDAQREKIRRVADYDPAHPQLAQPGPPRPPRMGREILSTLFEAARVHGTTIQLQAQPPGEGSPSGWLRRPAFVQPQKGRHIGLLRRPSPDRVARAARIWRLTLRGLVHACVERRYLPGGLV